MRKIKTREKAKGKDMKVLDTSNLVGQRMKNAFIRSKRNTAALMDDRQTTSSEYAEDKVELAADDLVHDTANVAVSGTKTAVDSVTCSVYGFALRCLISSGVNFFFVLIRHLHPVFFIITQMRCP